MFTGQFDTHTMMAVCSLVLAMVGMTLLLVQWTGGLYPGFPFFTAGILCQAIVFTLFSYARAFPPDVFALTSSFIYALFPIFCNSGIRTFAGLGRSIVPLLAVFAYETVLFAVFRSVEPALKWRVIAAQLPLFPFLLNSARIVWNEQAFRYPVLRPWLTATFVLIAACALCWSVYLFALAGSYGPGVETARTWYLTVRTGLSCSLAMGVISVNYKRASRERKENEDLLIADVEARIKVENALRQSEERFRILIERSPECLIVHRGGLILYANPAAVKLLSAPSLERLLGSRMRGFVHGDLASTGRGLTDHEDTEGPVETVWVGLDGRKLELELQSTRIVYQATEAFLTAAHDVSDLKRAAAERLVFERKLQETQKLESLGVLAGGIAHDFNNLLTGVLGNASLAQSEVGRDSPLQEYIQAIKDGANRAAELCREMLAYSGKAKFDIRAISVNELVNETVQLLKVSVTKSAVLEFELDAMDPIVEADATQMRQVVMNLVINASDALEDRMGFIKVRTGTLTVTPSYIAASGISIVQTAPQGEYAFFEVEDNGCGMSAETQARIFDPFFTTKLTGRGLGLAALLGIVRGHSGLMRLKSEVGRGTTFTILLPRSSRRVESAGSAETDLQAWRGAGRALVIDDEEGVRATAASMLKKLGFDALSAKDGFDGLELFSRSPSSFAFVLLDIAMPMIDGPETLERLRRIRRDVPVVVMTGMGEQEASSKFTGRFPAAFLSKPFELSELRRVLQAAEAIPPVRAAAGPKTGLRPSRAP